MKKICLIVVLIFGLASGANAIASDDLFKDQQRLAAEAYGVRFAEEDETAQESLTNALESLGNAEIGKTPREKMDAALSAWFWGINGMMRLRSCLH